MSIRSKFRIVTLCIVLILVVVVLAGYWIASVEVRKKIHNHLNLVVALQHDRLVDVLDRNFERLGQVSKRRSLQDNLIRFIEDSVEDSRDRVNNMLRDARLAVEGVTEVAILSEEGKVLASSNLDAIDSDISGELFFRERPEAGRGVTFDVGEDGDFQVVLSEPFVSEEEEEIGIIVIKSDGTNILAATEAEEGVQNRSLETILVKKDENGKTVILTPLKYEEAFEKPGEPLELAASGSTGFYGDAVDYRGKPVLAETRFFEDLGLGFMVKIDHDEAFYGLKRIRNFSLLALLLALVALEFVFLAIRGAILTPIQRLTETATKISEGDLSQRVEVGGNDEIGVLARDFNRMTEKLVELNVGLERKVEERTAELEQSNAELKQFAYVASHDLKEPLRMVSSYVQLLERRYGEQLGDDAKEFIGFAVDGAKRMQRLIDDLLAYSRVGTNAKPLQKVELGEVFDTVVLNLMVAIEESGAEVTSDELPAVKGDDIQLGQLFQNLIANAIKFRGEKQPKVHVGVERDGMMWRISVKDNGIGIKEDHIDRIFLIFQRLHTRDEYEGTGIGLAVCKKIVERHGGRISVTSAPGEGSEFVFTLPVFDAADVRPRAGGGKVVDADRAKEA